VTVRLFKRKQEAEPEPCPRCGQLVFEEKGSTCPMCGWDVHDAYQGPATVDEGEPQAAAGRGWDT
jgi:ribosomal protein L37E